MTTDRPLSIAQIAERWSCSIDSVYRLIRSGQLPAFRVGGKLLRVDALEVHVSRCCDL